MRGACMQPQGLQLGSLICGQLFLFLLCACGCFFGLNFRRRLKEYLGAVAEDLDSLTDLQAKLNLPLLHEIADSTVNSGLSRRF